jgi:hypothetical protein
MRTRPDACPHALRPEYEADQNTPADLQAKEGSLRETVGGHLVLAPAPGRTWCEGHLGGAPRDHPADRVDVNSWTCRR